MKRLFAAVLIIAFFASCKDGPYLAGTPEPPALSSQGVIMGPYLQAATAGSVFVSVECETAFPPVTVEYGADISYGNSVFSLVIEPTDGGTYIHNIRLTGLSPGSYCHYRVTRGAAVSGDYIFSAPAAEGTSFRFAWASDFQTGTNIHALISDRIRAAAPDFSIYGGDIASSGGFFVIKEEFFLREELGLLSQVPFFFTVGNHEGWTAGASRAFYQPPEGAPGDGGYYSFDYGDMHVLVMNSNWDFSQGSSQYNFAAADLASTPKKWKIVSVHHPAYWAGGTDYLPFDTAALRALVSGVFEPAGVNMVLSGHFHYYQHNLVNGMHHTIIATAGGGLDMPSSASYTLASADTNCYGIFDVDSVTMTVNVYNQNGNLVDGFVLN